MNHARITNSSRFLIQMVKKTVKLLMVKLIKIALIYHRHNRRFHSINGTRRKSVVPRKYLESQNLKLLITRDQITKIRHFPREIIMSDPSLPKSQEFSSKKPPIILVLIKISQNRAEIFSQASKARGHRQRWAVAWKRSPLVDRILSLNHSLVVLDRTEL